MIYSLTGNVEEIFEDSIVLNVKNISYKVYTAFSVISIIKSLGQELKIFTYLQLKEDGISLYGFSSKMEKNIFEILITVSGIGPKGAMGLINTLGINLLIKSIVKEDEGTLSTAPGIGKKTAKRIILETKDKFKDLSLSFSIDIPAPQNNEAVEALVALGYTKAHAVAIVDKVAKEKGLENTEDIIRASLSAMTKIKP
jgi:Holliday junction DNA helicase RuvA